MQIMKFRILIFLYGNKYKAKLSKLPQCYTFFQVLTVIDILLFF